MMAFAQQGAKPAADKWRPKDGNYAGSKADVRFPCAEPALAVKLGEKKIGGDEWTCKITRLTDTAPGAIRVDMLCKDYNLAQSIKDPNEERDFKEVMLFRRIDEKSMIVRMTKNSKFTIPDWRASYCSEEDQRLHDEAKAKDIAEAKPKAPEETSKLDPRRPRDGIYATAGTNFEDRCLKAGDATIEFSERSISSGAAKCEITFIRDEPNATTLFATCSQEPNPQGSTAAPRSSETIILKKINGTTIFLQKSKNGNFIDSGVQLSYCGQDAQRNYTEQKAKQ
jgi:hypothetical protein